MKYKVILFDVDGVLIEEKYLFAQMLKYDFGLKIDDMLPFFKGPFNDCKLGKADTKEELAKVIKDWGWQKTVDDLMDYWLTKGTEVSRPVLEFAKNLKDQGLELFVTTTQDKYRGERLRDLFCNDGTFNKVFFSAEIGYVKEDQGFWEYVFKNIGEVPKDEVLVIDDDPNVIRSAKEFGFETFLFTSLDKITISISKS